MSLLLEDAIFSANGSFPFPACDLCHDLIVYAYVKNNPL